MFYELTVTINLDMPYIGKTYSIENYEMSNIFNMLDHLLTNINYTAIQTWKRKWQWSLISCAGMPEYL